MRLGYNCNFYNLITINLKPIIIHLLLGFSKLELYQTPCSVESGGFLRSPFEILRLPWTENKSTGKVEFTYSANHASLRGQFKTTMHSALARVQAVFNYFTTVAVVIACLASLSVLLHPADDATANVELANVQVYVPLYANVNKS